MTEATLTTITVFIKSKLNTDVRTDMLDDNTYSGSKSRPVTDNTGTEPEPSNRRRSTKFNDILNVANGDRPRTSGLSLERSEEKNRTTN